MAAQQSFVVPSKVSDPTDAVVACLELHAVGDLGVCAAADKALSHLESLGLVRELNLHPSLVGIDPCNRGGAGVVVQEVALLASDIAQIGWSWAETSQALCVETTPNDATVEVFNQGLVAGSNGLAPVETGTIKYGSLSCSHTNYGLRAIGARAVSGCPLLARDGKYCVEHIQARDPEYARAVRDGLRWKVLSWRTRFLYPAVLDLMQRARNVASSVLRRENEMSGLLQLHALAASCPGNVEWTAIKKTVLKTNGLVSSNFNKNAILIWNMMKKTI